MAYRVPKAIKKDITSYEEIESELEEISKLKIIASSGVYNELKYYISIDKPEAIEVRIYSLTSENIYSRFEKCVEKIGS